MEQKIGPTLELIPHKLAPTLSGPEGPAIIRQLIDEVISGNFPTSNKIFKGLMREAGFVNLWFFLRCICAISGSFDLLNTDLHVEMCNIRQRWLKPGSRGAAFLPRTHLKSTIFTEGGSAWELLRNPNLRIRISNAVAEKAEGFAGTILVTFEYNDAVRWLYSEWCVKPGTKENWNKKVLIMPNRTKHYREASVETGGIEGSAEGHHHNVHIVDDMIGKKSLNAMGQANAVMESTKTWFWGGDSLLIVPRRDRVIVVGTRYGNDDVYAEIIERAYAALGHPMKYFRPNPDGEWEVYYRKAIENNEPIFPEAFDTKFYETLAKTNWQEYVTQWLNEPESGHQAELSSYKLKPCWLDRDESTGEFIVVFKKGPEEIRRPLSEMDGVQAADPASTETYVSSKTSRSTSGLLFTDYEWNRFLISLHADYVPVTTLFDWLFEDMERFGDYIRETALEAQGPYRMLGPLIETEESRRKRMLKLNKCSAVGDKIARIRTTITPELKEGRLYILEPYLEMVEEEQRFFPQTQKKDILDMITLAIQQSIRPFSPKELDEMEQEEDLWRSRNPNTAGW